MAIAHDDAAGLAPGFHAVASGDLAAVVTALEMRQPPAFLRRPGIEPDVPLEKALNFYQIELGSLAKGRRTSLCCGVERHT